MRRMKRGLIEMQHRLLCLLGVHRLCRWRHRRHLIILMYHGVVEDALEVECWTQMPVQRFRRQLAYLQRRYTVMDLCEAVQALQQGQALPDYTVALTFDDGFADFKEVAYPLLKTMRFPTTVYLATGCVGTDQRVWTDDLYQALCATSLLVLDLTDMGMESYTLATDDQRAAAKAHIATHLKAIPEAERQRLLHEICAGLGVGPEARMAPFQMLNWEDVQALYQEGLVQFGGHTVHHPILSQCEPAVQHDEIVGSLDQIEQALGVAPTTFAYPNGRAEDYDAVSQQVLRDRGLVCAVTTVEGLNSAETPPYDLRRLGLGSDVSMSRFKLLLSGAMTKTI